MNMETLNTYTSSKNKIYKQHRPDESTMTNSTLGDYCISAIQRSALPFPFHPLTVFDLPEPNRRRINESEYGTRLFEAVKKKDSFGLCLIGKDATPAGVVLAKILVEKYPNVLMSAMEAPLHYAYASELARVSHYRGERQDEELAPLKFHTMLIVDGMIDPKCKIWAEVEQFRRRNGKITIVCSPKPVAGFFELYIDDDEPQIDLAKLGRLLAATATEHPTVSKTGAVRLLDTLMEKASAVATP